MVATLKLSKLWLLLNQEEPLDSVASLLATILYQGNHDGNHKLWNIVSVQFQNALIIDKLVSGDVVIVFCFALLSFFDFLFCFVLFFFNLFLLLFVCLFFVFVAYLKSHSAILYILIKCLN